MENECAYKYLGGDCLRKEKVMEELLEANEEMYEALGLTEAAICQQGLQTTYPEIVAKARKALEKARREHEKNV